MKTQYFRKQSLLKMDDILELNFKKYTVYLIGNNVPVSKNREKVLYHSTLNFFRILW